MPTGNEAPWKPACLTARRKAWTELECGPEGRRTWGPKRTTCPALAIHPRAAALPPVRAGVAPRSRRGPPSRSSGHTSTYDDDTVWTDRSGLAGPRLAHRGVACGADLVGQHLGRTGLKLVLERSGDDVVLPGHHRFEALGGDGRRVVLRRLAHLGVLESG